MRLQPLLYRAVGLGLNVWSLFAPERAARQALQFFATPPKPRLRAKEQAFLATARIMRRQAGGYPVVEYHWGDPGAAGPLVLLSYGWGYNAGRWRHFVPALVEAGCRVLAYDPPGHGQAPAGQLMLPINAAIVRDLLEKYGPVFAIIGHSFGGSSSVCALQDLALPLRPQRMVLMASFSYAPYVFRGYRRMLGLWSTLYYRLVRQVERRFDTTLDSFDPGRLAGTLGGVEALLVHDPADPVTRFAEMRRYHAYWPGSALFRAAGGHHLGTPTTTSAVLHFVLTGELPDTAEKQRQALPAGHELSRYFAGL